MTRDIGYYWLRIVFYILVGITVGTLYFHIGTANNSILDRGKCVSFIYGFNICLSCGGLPFFIEELKVGKTMVPFTPKDTKFIQYIFCFVSNQNKKSGVLW